MDEKIKKVPWHEYAINELQEVVDWVQQVGLARQEGKALIGSTITEGSIHRLIHQIWRVKVPGKHAGELYEVIGKTSVALVTTAPHLARKLDELAQALCSEQRCTNCYEWHNYGNKCPACTTQVGAPGPPAESGFC